MNWKNWKIKNKKNICYYVLTAGDIYPIITTLKGQTAYKQGKKIMIIQHNSASKIEKVTTSVWTSNAMHGCLCFAGEGHDYNLAGEIAYSYLLDVENVIETDQFWFAHDETDEKVVSILEDIKDELESFGDFTIEQVAAFMDESDMLSDYSNDCDADWTVQQLQGVLAHRLGYDCAQSTDEQGVVYIAYCVNREMQEIKA